MEETKQIVDWFFFCGRHFITVAGYVIAMEGDCIRDEELYKLLPEKLKEMNYRCLTDEMIKHIVEKANE